MNKQYLNNVATAKESLKTWLSNFEQKHRGNQMFSRENDADREGTEFFKWYYGEGQTFSSFEAFREIESHYHKMFDLFLSYNKLSKTPIKKALFSNNTEKRKMELDFIYKKVVFSSIALIEHVTFFENRLIESPLFTDTSKPNILEVSETFENKTENIFNIVDKIAPKSYEKAIDEKNKNIVERIDDDKKEEIVFPVFEKKSTKHENDILFEIDRKDEFIEEEIVLEQEKKAILGNTNKNSEKKQTKDNNKILSKIEIEEEIRKILR